MGEHTSQEGGRTIAGDLSILGLVSKQRERIGTGKGASKWPEATDAQQKSDDGSSPAVARVIGRLGLTPSSPVRS
ncbi:hypothetical protein KOW79_016646 [Hemibagrus wyckioides]|uniref:Uncharacterized protein n=1 Tax=Hemibagrus wyckioides TaxID=337641 RepID=A0A9D3SHC2_9TELE|nr:hypothetical protein KOW79_016646 [Hemibagrus wyckioides]